MVRWQVRSGQLVLQQFFRRGGWADVDVVNGEGDELPGLPQGLKIEPGDVVVIHLEGCLSQHDCARMARHLKPLFPDNEVLILNPGMSIEIAKSDQGKG